LLSYSFCNPRKFLPYRQSMEMDSAAAAFGDPRPVTGAFVESQIGPPGFLATDFVSWGTCPGDMEARHGVTAPSLFRGGCRGGQPDGCRRAAAAYLATIAQP